MAVITSDIGHTPEDVLAAYSVILKKGGQRGTAFHRMAPFLVSDRFSEVFFGGLGFSV